MFFFTVKFNFLQSLSIVEVLTVIPVFDFNKEHSSLNVESLLFSIISSRIIKFSGETFGFWTPPLLRGDILPVCSYCLTIFCPKWQHKSEWLMLE